MKNLLAIAFATLFTGLAGCSGPNTPSPPDRAVAAETVIVGSTSTSPSVSIAGVVKPHLEADLSAQIVAPVVAVNKREGDHFRKGELLVRLHAPALQAGVTQSDAALQSAQMQESAAATQAKLATDNLGRYTQLRERRSVTPYELDQVRAQSMAAQAQQQSAAAQVSAARAALAAQQANAADANLYAPFDGVVTRRMADPGAMAAPGVPLLHLQSTGQKDVEFSVPDGLLSSLHIGSVVPASLNGNIAIDVKVADIAPAGDPGSHSFVVKANLPSSAAWNVGTVVQVQLPARGLAQNVAVPSRALIQQGGLDAVLAVAPDGRATVRYVTLGNASGGETQVLTGLHPGERIVAEGNLTLAGRRIEARP